MSKAKIVFNVIIFLLGFTLFYEQYRAAKSTDEWINGEEKAYVEEQKTLKATIDTLTQENEGLKKNFTYLNDLSDEERALYKQALESNDASLLALSPDKLVLVYLHAASNGQIELLHQMTAESGTLEEFKNWYESTQKQADLTNVLLLRDYESIHTSIDNEERATVTMTVSLVQAKEERTFELVKQNERWILQF